MFRGRLPILGQPPGHRLSGKGYSLRKRGNNVDYRFLPCSKGAIQSIQFRVKSLDKVQLLYLIPSYSWWIADTGAGLVRLGAALERNL